MNENKQNKNSGLSINFKNWFKKIFKEGKSLNGESITYISQIDNTRFLFSWYKNYEVLNHKYAVFDKKKNKYSKIPSGLLKKDDFVNTFRYDTYTKSYFIRQKFYNEIIYVPESKEIKKLLFVEPDNSEKPDGNYESSIDIFSFAIDQDNFYIITIDKIYIIDKRFIFKTIRRNKDEDSISIHIPKKGKDAKCINMNYPLGDISIQNFDCQFDNHYLYLIYSRDSYEIHFTRVVRVNTSTFEQKEFLLPVFYATDVRLLINYYEKDRSTFNQYLLLIGLLETISEEISGNQKIEFIFEKGIICTSNISYSFKLSDLKIFDINLFRYDIGMYYYLLYSDDISENQEGIINYLNHASGISEHDVKYLYTNYNKIFLDAFETEMDKEDDLYLGSKLDNFVLYLSYFPIRFELALKCLEGNRKRQYIGLSLYKGKVKSDVILDKWEETSLDHLTSLNQPSTLFESSNDIPIAKIKEVIDEAIKCHLLVEKNGINDNKNEVNLNKYVLEKSIEVVASWGNKEGEQIIRALQKKKIDLVDKSIAEEIGNFKIYPLKDLLITYLDYENIDVIKNTLSSVSSLRMMDYEEKINSYLGHMDDYVVHSASSALNDVGTDKSFSKLLYSYLISNYLTDSDEHLFLYENLAIYHIVRRNLTGLVESNNNLNKEDIKKISRITDLFLAYIWLVITFKDDTFKSAVKEEDKEIDEKLNILYHFTSYPKIRKHFNKSIIKKLLQKGSVREKHIIDILEWIIISNVSPDTTYLFGLGIVFSKNYLDFRKKTKNTETIIIYLKRMFENMYEEENDFRQLLASLALLELGVDRKWENIVLNYFDKNEWLGWTRASKMAAKVLEYLPNEKRTEVIISLINNTADIIVKKDYFEKLVDIDVLLAINNYEDGIIELNEIEEALLYG